MDRRIEMRAGVLDDPPPIEIEAVLAEIELLLQLDARHAEEGRKLRRHGVSEIDHRFESACRAHALGGGRRLNHSRGEAAGRGTFEETSATDSGSHRLLASGQTHVDLLANERTSIAPKPCAAQ